MERDRVLFLTRFSLLLAVEALFCFTPLGSIPIGPIVATLGMIPIIITAILMGTKAGILMGTCTGIFSLIVWTFMTPNPLIAFAFTPFYTLGEFSGNFWSLVICILPRAMVGLVAGSIHSAMQKRNKNEVLRYTLAGCLGSLTNTIGVMGGIWLFFGAQYASVLNAPILAIIGTTVLTNGIPEAIIAAVVAAAVCKPLKRIL